MSRRLLAAAVAMAASACEDWDQLACGLRHVCGGDGGGPFVLAGGADDPAPAPLKGFAAGEGTQVVLTATTLAVLADGGTLATLSPPGSTLWTALDAVGAPTRFFAATRSGLVQSWREPSGPGQPDVSAGPPFPTPAATAVAYLDDALQPAVAFFGTTGGSTVAMGVAADGGYLGSSSQSCDLGEPSGGAVVGWSTSVVAGASNACELLDPASAGFHGYVLSFWPRSRANPQPVALSPEPQPSRVRLSANGDVATVVYEVAGGLGAARVVDGGVANNLLAVTFSADGGASFRLLLDAVQQLGDPDAFVYALTNRNPVAIAVRPDAPGATAVPVPAGATLLVFARWPDRNSVQVTGTQLLVPSRPFSELRFALDPHQAEVWLVATCPAADGGAGDTYCPGPAAHHALFRWAPP